MGNVLVLRHDHGGMFERVPPQIAIGRIGGPNVHDVLGEMAAGTQHAPVPAAIGRRSGSALRGDQNRVIGLRGRVLQARLDVVGGEVRVVLEDLRFIRAGS